MTQKTGKGTMAKVMDDHLRMKKMGYSHEKPNVKETNKNDKSDDGEGMDAVQPKAVKKKSSLTEKIKISIMMVIQILLISIYIREEKQSQKQ